MAWDCVFAGVVAPSPHPVGPRQAIRSAALAAAERGGAGTGKLPSGYVRGVGRYIIVDHLQAMFQLGALVIGWAAGQRFVWTLVLRASEGPPHESIAPALLLLSVPFVILIAHRVLVRRPHRRSVRWVGGRIVTSDRVLGRVQHAEADLLGRLVKVETEHGVVRIPCPAGQQRGLVAFLLHQHAGGSSHQDVWGRTIVLRSRSRELALGLVRVAAVVVGMHGVLAAGLGLLVSSRVESTVAAIAREDGWAWIPRQAEIVMLGYLALVLGLAATWLGVAGGQLASRLWPERSLRLTPRALLYGDEVVPLDTLTEVVHEPRGVTLVHDGGRLHVPCDRTDHRKVCDLVSDGFARAGKPEHDRGRERAALGLLVERVG